MRTASDYPDIDRLCLRETGKSIQQEAGELASRLTVGEALSEMMDASDEVREAFEGSGTTSYVED